MLPPDFAAFSFPQDPAGADDAVAGRAAAACRAVGAASLVVVGAQRWGLVAALAASGLRVTAVDPSRAVLAGARRGLADRGLDGRVTLFASDPRDLEIPGGAEAVLVTSPMWRLLLHPEAQKSALGSIRRALRGPATLLLDLDRVPPLRAGRSTALRDGPARQVWRALRRGGAVTVTCESPGVLPVAVAMAADAPEAVAAAVGSAGFEVLSATNAATGGRLTSRSPRMWLVAQRAQDAPARAGRPRRARTKA